MAADVTRISIQPEGGDRGSKPRDMRRAIDLRDPKHRPQDLLALGQCEAGVVFRVALAHSLATLAHPLSAPQPPSNPPRALSQTVAEVLGSALCWIPACLITFSGHRSDYDARRRWFDWLRRLALCRGRPVARTQLAGSGSAGASREKHSVRRPRDCKPNNRSSPGRAGVAFASARPASSTSGRGRSGPPEKALAPRSWSVPSCRRWRRTSSPPAPGRPSCAAPRLR